MRLRSESAADRAAIASVERAAFGQDLEAAIVDRVRDDGHRHWSLVAEEDDAIVGHALFSEVRLDPAVPSLALAALGPIGVFPDLQRLGIGSALVREGLRVLAAAGVHAVFLLGEPEYYGRFGFTLAGPRGFHFESLDFDRGFQVLELVPGALDGREGWVRYHPSFTA